MCDGVQLCVVRCVCKYSVFEVCAGLDGFSSCVVNAQTSAGYCLCVVWIVCTGYASTQPIHCNTNNTSRDITTTTTTMKHKSTNTEHTLKSNRVQKWLPEDFEEAIVTSVTVCFGFCLFVLRSGLLLRCGAVAGQLSLTHSLTH